MKWITLIAFALTTAAAQDHVMTQAFTYSTGGGVAITGGTFHFEGKVVSGAPYSAQAVTETTQVLSDGNRISRKTSATLARDSMGRTHREETISFVGPWSVEGAGNTTTISINDPVAGVNYNLNTKEKTAVKFQTNAVFERRTNEKLEAELRAKREESMTRASAGAGGAIRIRTNDSANAKVESLGSKVIEGVQADGKRVTETIPAGRIGNEKQIDIINETWYSSELQMVVMSKHSDPRSGDVVYTLTNIQRAEPDPMLFQVPSDYKMRDEAATMELKRQSERGYSIRQDN